MCEGEEVGGSANYLRSFALSHRPTIATSRTTQTSKINPRKISMAEALGLNNTFSCAFHG